jgi:hypothetical protein
MSYPYHLRPNVRARMQRRLDAHVAVFGEQNKDEIVAVPSNTERSLSPDPDQAANHQSTDSTEDVVVIDGSDSGDSLSDLGSDSETVAPHTPSPRAGQVWPSSSHLDAPKAPQHIEQENRPEGSVVGSSSSVHDSPALIAEHKKALKAHLDRRRRRPPPLLGARAREYAPTGQGSRGADRDHETRIRGKARAVPAGERRYFRLPGRGRLRVFRSVVARAIRAWRPSARYSASHVAAGCGSFTLRTRTHRKTASSNGNIRRSVKMQSTNHRVAGRQGHGKRRSGSQARPEAGPLWDGGDGPRDGRGETGDEMLPGTRGRAPQHRRGR